MPKPAHPPTPRSSSDIRGKEGIQPAPEFNLPPAAFYEDDRGTPDSASPSNNGSDSSYRPMSPSHRVESVKRNPGPAVNVTLAKHDFALPPPPTRSRKIIQMKPQDSEQQASIELNGDRQAGKSQSASQSGSKRKQKNANTTAAGRKIARKTAHSLIERRRRSKINEEFGTLKDLIPACRGQEMHKLAILQASIEYLRYLERCVSDLKEQNTASRTLPPDNVASAPSEAVEDDDDDGDEEMEDDNSYQTTASTPATVPQDRTESTVSLPPLSQITTMTSSPSTFSVHIEAGRHYSISGSLPSYSPYIHSNQTSPSFGPQLSQISSLHTPSSATRETFGLGSPALKALDASQADKQRPSSRRSEQELDHEATAALLMLNTDRRSWRPGQRESHVRGTGGMSVKDLLSG